MTKWLKKIHSCIIPSIHSCIGSLFHWFINPLNHWFIASPIHWTVCFIDSLLYDSFTKSLVYCCAESTIHSFIGSLIHQIIVINWLVRCSVVIDSLIHRLAASPIIHWFTGSLFIGSLKHSFIHSFLHWFTNQLVQWLMNSLYHWFINSLIQCFNSSLAWVTDSIVHRLTI